MPKKAIRPIRIHGQVAYVPLTRGYEAIIDAADVHLVRGVNWYASVRSRNVYACHRPNRDTQVFMHRLLSGQGLRDQIDHVNGNGLDNRRENLRLASHAENARNQRLSRANKSGFKGVSFKADVQKWEAGISFNGKRHYLGVFARPEDAHKAYCLASAKLHRDFGRAE